MSYVIRRLVALIEVAKIVDVRFEIKLCQYFRDDEA